MITFILYLLGTLDNDRLVLAAISNLPDGTLTVTLAIYWLSGLKINLKETRLFDRDRYSFSYVPNFRAVIKMKDALSCALL